MNKQFQKFIKKITSDSIENYADTTPETEEDELGGSRDKIFVRCAGEVFCELISELRNNPNCSYVTYLNDVIKSEYNPQYISVLKRQERKDKLFKEKDKYYKLGNLADICASRILNFFECPTTYESILKIDGKTCICSVDFNNPNEDFYTLQGMNMVFSWFPNNKLIGILEKLDNSLTKFKNNQFVENAKRSKCLKKSLKNFDVMERQFEEDFIYSWLIRVVLLNDSDYTYYNIGLIHNLKDNTFRMAPNFDFEYCFNNLKDSAWTSSNMSNLQFIASRYPNVYRKFVDKLEQLLSRENGKSKGRRIIESVLGNEESAKPFIVDFRKHVRELYNLITEFAPVREEL